METIPDEILRVHIRVTGRVQGVGFRAHVEYYGLQIGVTGWVRNVGQDSVETIAEGARHRIEKFVELVKQGPRASRVDEACVEYEPVTGEFNGFDVKRSV
ncbi:acylphosphatase [Candidatus Villigracilis saccharophilus]|uniref:acylphosphatase n=1 Tax=Candidatus Villigracilis saccharophilus TaxID=3140684 RepID=UPI003137626E|nr:acylphosphatase [Anaerolineales bacterium]